MDASGHVAQNLGQISSFESPVKEELQSLRKQGLASRQLSRNQTSVTFQPSVRLQPYEKSSTVVRPVLTQIHNDADPSFVPTQQQQLHRQETQQKLKENIEIHKASDPTTETEEKTTRITQRSEPLQHPEKVEHENSDIRLLPLNLQLARRSEEKMASSSSSLQSTVVQDKPVDILTSVENEMPEDQRNPHPLQEEANEIGNTLNNLVKEMKVASKNKKNPLKLQLMGGKLVAVPTQNKQGIRGIISKPGTSKASKEAIQTLINKLNYIIEQGITDFDTLDVGGNSYKKTFANVMSDLRNQSHPQDVFRNNPELESAFCLAELNAAEIVASVAMFSSTRAALIAIEPKITQILDMIPALAGKNVLERGASGEMQEVSDTIKIEQGESSADAAIQGVKDRTAGALEMMDNIQQEPKKYLLDSGTDESKNLMKFQRGAGLAVVNTTTILKSVSNKVLAAFDKDAFPALAGQHSAEVAEIKNEMKIHFAEPIHWDKVGPLLDRVIALGNIAINS